MKVDKIYFDMDGVLADFDRGIVELCGLEPRDQEIDDPAVDKKMWEAVRNTEHFYDKLELMPGAREMFRLLWEKYPGCCEILTGIPKPKHGILTAGEDKTNWVRRMLSDDIPVHIVYKEEKKNYCTGKGCILIDDYSRNIKEWENAGGTGILHKNVEEALRQLSIKGILVPGSVEELIEFWKIKKECYRKGFDYGWPAKLVETSFTFKGEKYTLTPPSFGMEKYEPWDHGLMEHFQSALEQDLRAMGATDIYSHGFLD